MEKINVPLGKRSYCISIAAGLLNDPDCFASLKKNDRVMLITNEKIANLHCCNIIQVLDNFGINVDIFLVPEGEQSKDFKILNSIFTALLQRMHGRDAILIAFGGGVIGDLVGFAAATYQRGIRLIQVPTTLLSQIDSSIGGKTSINHPFGKNMIGAFHQPISVLIDLNFLKTLPKRELSSGLAEVIKYGVALDRGFFLWLERNIDELLLLKEEAIKYCVYHCCKLKANIIATDEYEIGLRTLLNLGHTYGHAIEMEMGYGNWLHGEAVSAGIVMAARTSEYLGYLGKEEMQRIINLLMKANLPVVAPYKISAQSFIKHMMRDKKVLAGKLRLVLPTKIGKSKIYSEISEDTVLNTIIKCQQQRKH